MTTSPQVTAAAPKRGWPPPSAEWQEEIVPDDDRHMADSLLPAQAAVTILVFLAALVWCIWIPASLFGIVG